MYVKYTIVIIKRVLCLHFIMNLQALGTITIRLRIEINNEKEFLMASLKPAPRFHVNMQKKMTLPVANFTCFGSNNEDNYDFNLIRSYVNEMLEMKRFLTYAIHDAVTSLMMWRGQVKIGSVYVPLHSSLAFFGGIYVIERPHLIPGCFFLSIAWVMLASLNTRLQHPSPWCQTRSFSHYLFLLMNGSPSIPVEQINSNQFKEESLKYEAYWETRIQTDLEAINKRWELQLEMQRIGNEDLQTEEKGNLADPIAMAKKSISTWLFPIQRRLRM